MTVGHRRLTMRNERNIIEVADADRRHLQKVNAVKLRIMVD